MFQERLSDNLTYQGNTTWKCDVRTLAQSADSLSSAFVHLDEIQVPITQLGNMSMLIFVILFTSRAFSHSSYTGGTRHPRGWVLRH